VICSTIFADYWEYSKQYHADPNAWMDLIHGTGGAPMQYRIGILRVADLLRRHGHMGLRHAFTLIDLFGAAVAVNLLFSLFERSMAYRGGSEAARWFGAAAFLFLVQYYFAWVAWYQRPETMASAAVLAATMWLLAVRLPFPRVASAIITPAAMLILAAMQGFIRADVAVAMHLGVFLVCLTHAGTGFSLPRGVQAVTSALCVLIAGGTQLYLMHVVYPQASYGDTPVLQILQNLTLPIRWIPFVLYMMPWGWLLTTLLRRRSTAEIQGVALVTGSAVYVAVWSVVGKIDEVRIFLPYALALAPVTCACAMQRFLPVTDASAHREGPVVSLKG
jgi:hypothetical protein